MKNKQNQQAKPNKNCGNKNCGKNKADDDKHEYRHGGNV